MTSHTVIIASIWEFYDVQSLLQKLEQATGGILARYSYEESKKHFIVKCKPEEESQVTETFFRILREYVNEELRKESNQPNDPFDRPQVNRLPDLNLPSPPNYFKMVLQNKMMNVSSPVASPPDQLITHESVSAVIKLDEEGHLTAASIFTDDVLRTLGRTTKSRIELQDSVLKIWADEKENVEEAMDKIRVFQSASVGPATHRRIFDAYSMPSLAGFKLRFSFCAGVTDQSMLKAHASFAANYYDLRAVKWHTESLQYLSVLEEGEPIKYPTGIQIPWSQPLPFSYGDESLNPKYWAKEYNLAGHPLPGRLSPTQTSRVAHWAQQVDDAHVSDPYGTIQCGNSRSGEELQEARRGKLEITGSRPTPSLVNVLELSKEDFSGNGPGQSSCTSRAGGVQHGLEAMYKNEPSNSTEPSHTLLVHDTLCQADRGGELGRFEKTPPLKAGTVSDGKKDPLLNLLPIVQTAIAKLFASLEVSSEVQPAVELQLGQIFIKGNTVPKRYQCSQSRPSEPFPWEEWDSIFDTRSGEGKAVTVFSPKLTAAWEDAYFIANLAHPTRKYMFECTPKSDVSTYQLLCLDQKTGAQASIEISNDSGPARICLCPHEIGTINIHFPNQTWDARICMTNQTPLDPQTYQSLRAIANHIWIHAVDGANPHLERLYTKTLDSQISIVSGELRRSIVYQARGTGKDVFLNLTQAEKLEISELSGGLCMFSAREETPFQSDALWEAKLLSMEIEKLSKMLCEADIKGFIHWSNSVSLRSSLHSLISCADSIVTNIDHVGYSSRKRVALNGSAISGSTRKGQSAASGLQTMATGN